MRGSYLIWLSIFFALPAAVLWTVFYRQLWPYRMVYLKLIGLSVLAGTLWDAFAIATNLWIWPPACCLLPRIIGLPLEEWLFMALATVIIVSLVILLSGYLVLPERRP
ncbi:MAG TPA: lycopene cyclase domain-containing protein [Candidatus Saccharimonadia bacterium]|jgi:lycopene cyclase domain-containing protein|nr:lycopene cyclase domain-containing protein [Candidatus Saccharimonadia bacterium]